MMDMTDKEKLEMDMIDAVMESPYEFFVGDHQYFIYRPTLGKTLLVSRLLRRLDMDAVLADPVKVAVSAVKEHKDIVLQIIAYYTFDKKMQHFNSKLIEKRTAFFDEHLDDKETAALFLTMITLDNYDAYLTHVGLDEDMARRQRASDCKEDRNSLVFGGKTLFGSMVGAACEKYGWSYDYAVWGVSLIALRMLTADSVTSVYMSDEELKRYGNTSNGKSKGFAGFLAQLKGTKLGR